MKKKKCPYFKCKECGHFCKADEMDVGFTCVVCTRRATLSFSLAFAGPAGEFTRDRVVVKQNGHDEEMIVVDGIIETAIKVMESTDPEAEVKVYGSGASLNGTGNVSLTFQVASNPITQQTFRSEREAHEAGSRILQ